MITRPGLNEQCISFLVHVNGNHWVAVVRRNHLNNETVFYYADDMNCESTAREVKVLFERDNADPEFYPPQAKWIVCDVTTYLPHNNECGPRALIHALQMPVHPTP